MASPPLRRPEITTMEIPVMASAFHIGCVVTLSRIKDARYSDPAARWTVVRYNTNASWWIVKLVCGSRPEIAVCETNMLESAGAASVPEDLAGAVARITADGGCRHHEHSTD